MRRSRSAGLVAVVFCGGVLLARAQEVHPAFSRLNSFGGFSEYSNTSSHIVLGGSRQRKLLTFGASYGRRLLLRPSADLQYFIELRPVLLVGDPVTQARVTITSPGGSVQVLQNSFRPTLPCRSGVFVTTFKGPQGETLTATDAVTCGRQWTYGQGFSPVGFKLNLRPRHALQPVFTALGGYVISTQPIPISAAGSFNFTFEIGAGVELYLDAAPSRSLLGNRSIRAEYRYHHISNAYTATRNPGIDSGVFQVTYAFGR